MVHTFFRVREFGLVICNGQAALPIWVDALLQRAACYYLKQDLTRFGAPHK